LAQAFEPGDLPRRAIKRHGLEIRSAENRPMQAGAVMQQVSLGDVAAHAVPEQHNRHAGMLLADVLVEAGQIAHHFAPAIAIGEMTEGPVFGSFAMAAQIRRIHAVTLFAEFFRQTRIAPTVFGHAMGQQNHALGMPAGSHWLTKRRLWSLVVSQKVSWIMAFPLLGHGTCGLQPSV
jgi:hypothetical protein